MKRTGCLRCFAAARIRRHRSGNWFRRRTKRGIAKRSPDEEAVITIAIAPLTSQDRAEWEPLARGYKAFYEESLPDEDYARTWALLMANEAVHGLAARSDGRMVGIAHYLFHPHVWRGEVCYLQDLFTAPEARGLGVARALIEAVAAAARTRGASACYWLTRDSNLTARALYDKVARFKGFLRYDYPL